MEGKRDRDPDEEVSSVSKRLCPDTNVLRPWIDGDFVHMNDKAVWSLIEEARARHEEWVSETNRHWAAEQETGRRIKWWTSHFEEVSTACIATQTGHDRTVSMLARAFGHEMATDLFSPHERRLMFLDVKKIAAVEVHETVPAVIRTWIRDAYMREETAPEFHEYIGTLTDKCILDSFIAHVSHVLLMTPEEIVTDQTILDKKLVVDVANAVRSKECWLHADEDAMWMNLIRLRETLDLSTIHFDE